MPMLIENLKLNIAKTASVKIALNAEKARALAKSVGLVPHYKSDWKWALRQMRAKNPSASQTAPLMQSGKELIKTKERIGKFTNNEMQKIKSESRRSGHNKELVITDRNDAQAKDMWGELNPVTKKPFATTEDKAQAYLPNFLINSGLRDEVRPNPLRSRVGHLHPNVSRIEDMQASKRGPDAADKLDELSALMNRDDNLSSRSGALEALLRNTQSPAEFTKLYNNIPESIIPIKDKLLGDIANRAASGSGLTPSDTAFIKNMLESAQFTRRGLSGVISEAKSGAKGYRGQNMEAERLLDKTLAASPSKDDVGGIYLWPNRRDRHVIISPHTQGVHAKRPGEHLESRIRSVYFDGGILD